MADVWYETFDGAFWLTLAGIVSGIIVALIKTSNCTRVKACCFECVRPPPPSAAIEDDVSTKPDVENLSGLQ